jgi:hypothetical protein
MQNASVHISREGQRISEKVVIRLLAVLSLIFVLSGCGGAPTKACDDSDPVGPCATSHSQTHGG